MRSRRCCCHSKRDRSGHVIYFRSRSLHALSADFAKPTQASGADKTVISGEVGMGDGGGEAEVRGELDRTEVDE